jgi:hypothetical protein
MILDFYWNLKWLIQNQNLNEYYFINHKREFVAKVRNKSFIVMTFKSAAVCVYLCGYLSSMKAETKRIAIHDEWVVCQRIYSTKQL